MGKGVWILALVGALFLWSGRASAWNSHGHMTVAKIAYDQLSDSEKLKIHKILKQHPHYEKLLLVGKPRNVAEQEWVFLKAATWPDLVRPGGRKPREITQYHREGWHFLDKPFINPTEADDFKEDELQPKGETILTALPRCIADVNEGKTDLDKSVALCWVLHLVGDVHQPLHCATFFSSTFPKGDRGGNSQLVKAHGKVIPLHTWWDALIGTSMRYPVVEASAYEITRDAKYKRAQFKAELDRQKLSDWADESFKLARAIAYLDGDLKSQKVPHPREEGEFEVPDLPLSYDTRARNCARGRIALAGYRLADKLKEILE
jgi:hypothetical protein